MAGLVLSASALKGDRVVNPDGAKLGRLKELMIDVDSGAVVYAVIGFGGFLGRGDKLFAVPWSALSVDSDGRRLLLDVARANVENAPGFDPDHWPDPSDLDSATQTSEHQGPPSLGGTRRPEHGARETSLGGPSGR